MATCGTFGDLGTASIVDNIDPFSRRIARHVPPTGFGRMNGLIAGPDGRMWTTSGGTIDAFEPEERRWTARAATAR